jgi:hypothetical protein
MFCGCSAALVFASRGVGPDGLAQRAAARARALSRPAAVRGEQLLRTHRNIWVRWRAEMVREPSSLPMCPLVCAEWSVENLRRNAPALLRRWSRPVNNMPPPSAAAAMTRMILLYSSVLKWPFCAMVVPKSSIDSAKSSAPPPKAIMFAASFSSGLLGSVSACRSGQSRGRDPHGAHTRMLWCSRIRTCSLPAAMRTCMPSF